MVFVDLNLASLDPTGPPPNPRHKDLYVEVDYMCSGFVVVVAEAATVQRGHGPAYA